MQQKASGTPSSAETEGEARISASDSVSSTTTEEASRPKGPKDGNKPEPERATQQDEKDAGKDSDTTTRMSDGKDSDTTPRMSDGKDRKEGIDQGDRAEHDSNKATEKNAKPTEDSGPKKDQKPESDKNKEKSSTTPAPPKDKKTKISKADPSSSDVSADRGVAVPHKCMGSNITAMRMEESEVRVVDESVAVLAMAKSWARPVHWFTQPLFVSISGRDPVHHGLLARAQDKADRYDGAPTQCGRGIRTELGATDASARHGTRT